jgi:signal peptide peptidase SppA
MAKEYARVLRALTEKPWNIRRPTLDLMVQIVRARASGVQLTQDEIQAQLGTQAARPTQQIIGTVGVLPVVGILAQKMDMFVDYSGGTSTQQLIKQFRVFRDDPQVKAIVFEHDSPGGEVFGLIEAAEEIYAARDTKRLIAVVNPFSASASLFLAAACHEIVVTPSGELGCIGTIWCHHDYSAMNEIIGVKPTYLTSSPYKAEGNQDNPLGDEAEAYIQSQIDAYGDQFEKFVAKGRGVSVAKVKKDFGGGRMLLAKEALKVGLCDRIATMDETIAKLVGRKASVAVSGARAAVTIPEQTVATNVLATEELLQSEEALAAAAPAPPIVTAKKKKADDEGTPPDENGVCAAGTELDEDDGLCYPVSTDEPTDAQAAADRDAFDLTRATGL